MKIQFKILFLPMWFSSFLSIFQIESLKRNTVKRVVLEKMKTFPKSIQEILLDWHFHDERNTNGARLKICNAQGEPSNMQRARLFWFLNLRFWLL